MKLSDIKHIIGRIDEYCQSQGIDDIDVKLYANRNVKAFDHDLGLSPEYLTRIGDGWSPNISNDKKVMQLCLNIEG